MGIVLTITIFVLTVVSFALAKNCKENRNDYIISGISGMVLFLVIQLTCFTVFSIGNILLLSTIVIHIFTKGNNELEAQYTLPFALFTLVAYEIALFL